MHEAVQGSLDDVLEACEVLKAAELVSLKHYPPSIQHYYEGVPLGNSTSLKVALTDAGRRVLTNHQTLRSDPTFMQDMCRSALLDWISDQPQPVNALGFLADPRSAFFGEEFTREEVGEAFERLLWAGLIVHDGRSTTGPWVRITKEGQEAARRSGPQIQSPPYRGPITGHLWLDLQREGIPAASWRGHLIWKRPEPDGYSDGYFKDGDIWLGLTADLGLNEASYNDPYIWRPGFLKHAGGTAQGICHNGFIWDDPLSYEARALPVAAYKGEDPGAAAAAVALNIVKPY